MTEDFSLTSTEYHKEDHFFNIHSCLLVDTAVKTKILLQGKVRVWLQKHNKVPKHGWNPELYFCRTEANIIPSVCVLVWTVVLKKEEDNK